MTFNIKTLRHLSEWLSIRKNAYEIILFKLFPRTKVMVEAITHTERNVGM